LNYVYEGACLYASIFGIPTYDAKKDEHLIKEKHVFDIVSKMTAAPYKKGAVNWEEGKKKASEEMIVSDEDSKEIEHLTKHLSAVDVKKFGKLFPADFEKDDDTNHHIAWITAATNMRSWNYSIEPSKNSSVRMTAGRIIPAIATTTATITGFVQLEVFKYLLGLPIGTFRQATIDLGTNVHTIELLPDLKVTGDHKEKVEDEEKSTDFKKEYKMVQWRAFPNGKGFSVWDKVVINKGDISFNGLVKELETLFPGLKVENIFKRNITKKEVDEGKGSNLWSSTNPFAAQFKTATAKLPTTTHAALKAMLERDIANYNNAEKKKEESVAKRYLSVYGDLVTKDRNYFMLEGNYSNTAGEKAVIPPILLVFKDGSWA